MNIEPRQYQKDCGNAIVRELSRRNSTMAVMATGLGKTIVATMLMEYYTGKKLSVLFLAHRDTLIKQAIDKLMFATGLTCGVEKAELTAHDSDDLIVVGSVQSFTPERLARYDRGRFDLIIIDEAHLSASDSYVRIIEHFGSAKLVGITATAYRHDSKSLGDIFDSVAYEYNLRDAIRDGWLCPIVSQTVSLDITLNDSQMYGGDYSDKELSSTIVPLLDNIAKSMDMIKCYKKSLCFLPLVKTSVAAQSVFSSNGFNIKHVDGALKERHDVIRWFEDWNEPSNVMLTNPMMLSVGYDHPPIDSVIWLRPTTSTLLYTQGIGRGTRLHEGKEHLFVPDFIMNGSTHDLCRPACLIAESKEQEDIMNEIASGSSMPQGLSDIQAEADNELVDRREAKLASHIKEFKGMKTKTYDPVLGTMAMFDNRISDWSARVSSEAQGISGEQVRFLEKEGFDPTGWKSGYADLVIKKIEDRKKQGLASSKQLRLLSRQHIKNAHEMTFEQASDKISALQRKWQYLNNKRKVNK